MTPSPENEKKKALGCTEGWFVSCQELKNISFVAHLVPDDGIGHLQDVRLPHTNIQVDYFAKNTALVLQLLIRDPV